MVRVVSILVAYPSPKPALDSVESDRLSVRPASTISTPSRPSTRSTRPAARFSPSSHYCGEACPPPRTPTTRSATSSRGLPAACCGHSRNDGKWWPGWQRRRGRGQGSDEYGQALSHLPGLRLRRLPRTRDSTPYKERYSIPEAQTVVRGTLRYQGIPAVHQGPRRHWLPPGHALERDPAQARGSWKEATQARVIGAARRRPGRPRGPPSSKATVRVGRGQARAHPRPGCARSACSRTTPSLPRATRSTRCAPRSRSKMEYEEGERDFSCCSTSSRSSTPTARARHGPRRCAVRRPHAPRILGHGQDRRRALRCGR